METLFKSETLLYRIRLHTLKSTESTSREALSSDTSTILTAKSSHQMVSSPPLRELLSNGLSQMTRDIAVNTKMETARISPKSIVSSRQIKAQESRPKSEKTTL
jgi:hypothetical protein